MTDAADKILFDLINREIDRLLSRLEKKAVCPCCAARALMHRGAHLMADVVDADAVLETCDDIADQFDDDADAAPAGSTQH
jgi:hypothetical protein